MPAKKKKGKASKLARMSDEERARYLQHRADVELEAKRRKQQLIAVFTKNKLKREEAFSRINTAKLNEQWRATLRQLKCGELKEDVQQLWQDFEEKLKMKEDFVKRLFDELVESDLDHRRFQQAHMMTLDDMISKGKERIDFLHEHHADKVRTVERVDVEDLKTRKRGMSESLAHLKSVIYAKARGLEQQLAEIETRNAVSVHSVVYSKEESLLSLKRDVYPRMELLWQQLNDVISSYELATESKRKQYEYLKQQDDAHQAETSQFPKLYAQLRNNLESLRKNLAKLSEERQEVIEDMRLQSQALTKRVCKLRQQMKVTQTLDSVQLKRLSVLSGEAVKQLERILDRSADIGTISKLCADLEPDSINVKKYSIKSLEAAKELVKPSDEPFAFLRNIEGFRDHLSGVLDESTALKRERNKLAEDNSRLKHSLRSYLMTVSRMPTISNRPCTRA